MIVAGLGNTSCARCYYARPEKGVEESHNCTAPSNSTRGTPYYHHASTPRHVYTLE